MLEALCRQSSTTLDIMHAEDGPPITQRTSGLEPQDWAELASALTSRDDPLFNDAADETFDEVRTRILQLEKEAEADRARSQCLPWGGSGGARPNTAAKSIGS
jgi:hypothetical protein